MTCGVRVCGTLLTLIAVEVRQENYEDRVLKHWQLERFCSWRVFDNYLHLARLPNSNFQVCVCVCV